MLVSSPVVIGRDCRDVSCIFRCRDCVIHSFDVELVYWFGSASSNFVLKCCTGVIRMSHARGHIFNIFPFDFPKKLLLVVLLSKKTFTSCSSLVWCSLAI